MRRATSLRGGDGERRVGLEDRDVALAEQGRQALARPGVQEVDRTEVALGLELLQVLEEEGDLVVEARHRLEREPEDLLAGRGAELLEADGLLADALEERRREDGVGIEGQDAVGEKVGELVAELLGHDRPTRSRRPRGCRRRRPGRGGNRSRARSGRRGAGRGPRSWGRIRRARRRRSWRRGRGRRLWSACGRRPSSCPGIRAWPGTRGGPGWSAARSSGGSAGWRCRTRGGRRRASRRTRRGRDWPPRARRRRRCRRARRTRRARR